MSNVRDRLKEYIQSENIPVAEFERQIGVGNGYVKNISKSIQPDKLEIISNLYPSLSIEWLLLGKGNMRKNETIQLIHHPKLPDSLIENQDVILYDISAAANLKTLLADKSQNIIGKISLPNIPKCDGAVYVRGDSMYPLLKSGDIIAYKEIHDFSSVIKGEMYLVSFDLDGDEYLTVKYVNKSEQNGYIKLVSYNPHHDPMDIPISSINAMAIVKVSIRMNTMK